MAIATRDNKVTERLRDWINMHYLARGKFTQLQADSKISAQKWKDVYYKRQYANEEMIAFVGTQSIHDMVWIRSGVRPPRQDNYHFGTQPPTPEECSSLQGRLIWAIREWAAPTGAALFKYLEEKSHNQISADEWASVILRHTPPSVRMIELVCSERYHLAAWIVMGWAPDQVNPANEDSIKHFEVRQSAEFDKLVQSFKKNGNDAPNTPTGEALKDEPKLSPGEIENMVNTFFGQIPKHKKNGNQKS